MLGNSVGCRVTRLGEVTLYIATLFTPLAKGHQQQKLLTSMLVCVREAAYLKSYLLIPFVPLAMVTQPGGRPLSRWISHSHLHFGDFGLAESLGLNFAEPISPERRFSRGGPSLLKGLPSRSRGTKTFSVGSLQRLRGYFNFHIRSLPFIHYNAN